MPFKSKAQERAAFSGALGPEMKAKAPQWAKETPNQAALPAKVKKPHIDRGHVNVKNPASHAQKLWHN